LYLRIGKRIIVIDLELSFKALSRGKERETITLTIKDFKIELKFM